MPTKLITPLSNGNGSFFVRCHCCHATSPDYHASDDLRILAAAKADGWVAIWIDADSGCLDAGRYRHFCNRPRCQRQAEV